jgi:predicted RNA-binding protein YlxR (DUF448 family)
MSNIRNHVPQRTCIACRETKAKRELIRLVQVAGEGVEVDPTGKKAGRGTYLCPSPSCWEIGLKRDRLERALRTKIAPQNRYELALYTKNLPQRGDGGESGK